MCREQQQRAGNSRNPTREGLSVPPPPVTPTHSRARSQSTPPTTHTFGPSAALRLEAASEGSKMPAQEEVTVPPGTSEAALSTGQAWQLGLKLCSPFCDCSRHLT